MSVSELFIRRPIGTSLLMVAVMITGIIAYQFLPVSALPRIDYPTVSVSANLPGADPETMAASVAAPLERRFGQIAGVSELTSVSGVGTSRVTIQFALDRNIDYAVRDVQAAISAAHADLPAGLPNPPTWRKANPSEAPVIILALTSDALTPGKLYQAASTVLAQRIAQVEGVAQVNISGAQKSAVRVKVDSSRLAAMGLSMEDVRTQITASNARGPKGNLDGTNSAYTIGANDQLYTAENFSPIVLRTKDNSIVRLSAVANVTNDVLDNRVAGWFGLKRAVLVMITKQPDANVIETVDSVKALLPEVSKWMPPSVKIEILSDRTTTIRASVSDVQRTMTVSVCLVVGIVFLFLRRLWSTFAAASMVPLCLTGTFAGMYLCGYSIDNLSLMALTVAVGFVVDDAIVMIENISRRADLGDEPLQAAITGSKQIGFTIISISASLIAVFIPLFFMSGIIGRLFHEFAITLTLAIVVSAVVSLTGTPMLCAYLAPRKSHSHQTSWFDHTCEGAFERVLKIYEYGLDWVLKHRTFTLLLTLGTVILTVYLYIEIPKGIFPQQDTGRVSISTEARADISFQAMSKLQYQVAEEVLKNPDVAALASSIGSGGYNSGSNSGSMFVDLKPQGVRKHTVDEVVTELRKVSNKVKGINVFPRAVQDLNVGGRQSKLPYQYALSDLDINELNEYTLKIYERLSKVRELQGVTTDQTKGGMQANLVIDRIAASRMGISMQDIDAALNDAFGQRQIAVIYTEIDQYRVVLDIDEHLKQYPEDINRVYVRSSVSGGMIPLKEIAKMKVGLVPLAITHQGQFPSTTISFGLAPNVSLGEASKAIEAAVQELNPPAGLRTSFQGTAAVFQASIASTPWLVLTSLAAIYLILGILYESLIHPLTILSTIPSAGIGALLALMAFGYSLDVMGIIGIILLIGIVKKNAIMMIDFALEAERNEKKAPVDAIREACLLRFRPIIMTTLAALLGALPLALGQGVGSELRHPLGVAIVGGLIVSQALTLFTTPVVYLALDSLRPARAKNFDAPTEIKLAQSF